MTRAGWADNPEEVRARFEAKMTDATETVTGRIAKFLVPRFDTIIETAVAGGTPPPEAAGRCP